MKKSSKNGKILGAIGLSGAVLFGSVHATLPDQAQATTSVEYYLSGPFVQNSFLITDPDTGILPSGAELTTMLQSKRATFLNFNIGGVGSCDGTSTLTLNDGDPESSIPNTTITATISNCSRLAGADRGGATTMDSNPTFGGTKSNFAIPNSPSAKLTISFSEAQKYLGFWWSTGSAGNRVDFFTESSGGEPVLTLNTIDIVNILGDHPVDDLDIGSTGTVSSIGGTPYTRHYYFGHPGNHTSLTPTTRVGSQTEPYVYVHAFALQAGSAFRRIEMFGDGVNSQTFEIDNLVASSLEVTPDPSLVSVSNPGVTPPSDPSASSTNSSKKKKPVAEAVEVEAVPGSGLAATGPDSLVVNVMMGVSIALLLIGLALVAMQRGRGPAQRSSSL